MQDLSLTCHLQIVGSSHWLDIKDGHHPSFRWFLRIVNVNAYHLCCSFVYNSNRINVYRFCALWLDKSPVTCFWFVHNSIDICVFNPFITRWTFTGINNMASRRETKIVSDWKQAWIQCNNQNRENIHIEEL